MKFLEDELLVRGVEVGHWCVIRDVVCRAGGAYARVETAKEVEDQLGRRDNMADIA